MILELKGARLIMMDQQQLEPGEQPVPQPYEQPPAKLWRDHRFDEDTAYKPTQSKTLFDLRQEMAALGGLIEAAQKAFDVDEVAKLKARQAVIPEIIAGMEASERELQQQLASIEKSQAELQKVLQQKQAEHAAVKVELEKVKARSDAAYAAKEAAGRNDSSAAVRAADIRIKLFRLTGDRSYA